MIEIKKLCSLLLYRIEFDEKETTGTNGPGKQSRQAKNE